MAETATRDERHLELVARVRKAIKAAWYPGIDWDSDVLAYAALTAAEQVRARFDSQPGSTYFEGGEAYQQFLDQSASDLEAALRAIAKLDAHGRATVLYEISRATVD